MEGRQESCHPLLYALYCKRSPPSIPLLPQAHPAYGRSAAAARPILLKTSHPAQDKPASKAAHQPCCLHDTSLPQPACHD